MSYTGTRPNFNTVKFRPRSADPVNPTEGEQQYADGTVRAEGLWVYKNGAWEAVGGLTSADFTLTNNQSTPADITGFLVNNAENRAFVAECFINRNHTSSDSTAEDTTFYTNLTSTGSGLAFNATVTSGAIQSTGKILIGGGFTALNGATRNALVRLNSDGTEDTAFYTNLGTGFSGGNVLDVVVQSDDKIIVVGDFTSLNGNTRNRIVRLNSDGTEDTAFYTNLGTAIGAGDGRRIYVQTDNKILIGGAFTSFNGNTRHRLIRLNSDGTEDTTFYTNLTSTGDGSAFDSNVYAINIQSDNKIIVGGNFISFNGISRNHILRLNSDGTEDTAFYSGSGFNADVFSIKVQLNDKILIVGSFSTFNGNTRGAAVRLNSDGTEDTAFYTNLGTGFSGGQLKDINIQTDNRILIGGNFTSLNGNTRNRIVRLNSDGTEDTAFYTALGTGFGGADINRLLIQTDNDIVTIGGFTSLNGNTRNRAARLAIDLASTLELTEQRSFKGLYRSSLGTWELGGETYIGDNSGITLSITNSGQLQYTSTNLANTSVEELFRWVIIKL